METEPKRILVIDDDPAISEALNEMLSVAGFAVSTAPNGVIGLNLALKEHPHLILLDIMMPEMNGWEMLEKLREDEWGKTVPLIILTNLESVDNISKAIEKDAYEYIVKGDSNIGEIIAMVKRKLGIA